jgi:hypothetical protein
MKLLKHKIGVGDQEELEPSIQEWVLANGEALKPIQERVRLLIIYAYQKLSWDLISYKVFYGTQYHLTVVW